MAALLMNLEESQDLAKILRDLKERVKQLESENLKQKEELAELQKAVRRIRESSEVFEKAFRIVGFNGDYVEFGAYRGDSMISAYYASRRVLEEITGGVWDHSFSDAASSRSTHIAKWDKMRFFAFDSFQGLPTPVGIDTISGLFEGGTYSCTEADFRGNLRKYGIPDPKVITEAGFFEKSLTSDAATRLQLNRISILHIDSDLYASARLALEFCTPFFMDGTVIIFDEWYQNFGNPDLGEQRAFRQWMDEHPEWMVTPFQKEGAFRNSFVLSKPHDPVSKKPVASW